MLIEAIQHVKEAGGNIKTLWLNPGEVTALRRWHAGKIASIRITRPNVFTPFLKRERWIGDHAIEVGETIASMKRRMPQGVAPDYLKVLDENDWNLNIPRYIDPVIEEETITVAEAIENLKTSLDAAYEAEDRLKQLLSEHGLIG